MPENVSARAPHASPRRAISARPRVISAAFALSPGLEAVDARRRRARSRSSRPRRARLRRGRCSRRRESGASGSRAGARWRAPRSCSRAPPRPAGPARSPRRGSGPESTSASRSVTTCDSRLPVSGSSPFVRMRTGASPGSAAVTSRKARLGTRDADELRGRHLRSSRGASRPASVDLVPALLQRAGERRTPRARPDDGDLHPRRTKSMITGTPSRPKCSRSRFSTQ